MPRLLQLIYSLDRGGAEVDLVAKAKILSRWGYKIKVVCLVREGTLAQTLKDVGIEVESLSMRGKYDITCLYKLWRVLSEFKPEILHTHLFASNLIGRIIRGVYKVGVLVCTIQNSADLMKPWEIRVDSLLWRLTDKFIASSYAVKESLMRRIGVPEDKITVIYNGIELDRAEKKYNISTIKKEFGIDNEVVLCSIARLHPIKGLDYLIEAAAIIKEKQKRFKLLIIGEGKQRQRLTSQIRHLSLQEYVLLLGERADVDKILQIVDIFILPSLSEALSVALLEALLFKKPAIATGIGGILEVIKDNETGFLVPPKDKNRLAEAILYCMENQEKIKSVGEVGHSFVKQHFDIERLTMKLDKLYKDLLENKCI